MQRILGGGEVSPEGIAEALEFPVASANNPVELNTIGTSVPDWRLAVQSVAGTDTATLYRLEACTDPLNPPYSVASITPGLQWIALTGRFANRTFTSANNINAGDNTGVKIVTAAGGNTNAGDGSYLAVRNAGAPVILLGNQSAINGGAYNANPYMQVGPAGASRLSMSGALSVFHPDNAVSPITGAVIIGDLVTPTLNVGIGGGNIVAGGNVSVRNVPYTWPVASSAGQLTNDGAGLLTWTPAGGSSGSAINYCTNPNAEVNTAGWATYADAPGVQPVDGTGGAPTVTWIRNTVNPLRGVASFNLVKTAVNSQGQGASFDFTINLADTNKSLSMGFDTSIVSGTYAANDVTCWVYDVTNARLIPVSSANGISGGGAYSAQFTTSASVSYRFIIHIGTVSALAYTLAFDNVALGPTYIQSMPAGTDWQDAGTLTIGAVTTAPTKGATSRDRVQWRRSGDTGIYRYVYEQTGAGAAGSGHYLFSLPAGQAFDSTKIAFYTGATAKGGEGICVGITTGTAGSTHPGVAWIIPYDATRFRVYACYDNAGNVALEEWIGSTGYPLSIADAGWHWSFQAPIATWSNSQAVQPGTRYLWAQRYSLSATRVTATPTALGQYRARRVGVDTAPTTVPTIADGIRIDAGSGIAAGRINAYDVFVGTGKVVQLTAFKNAGRTGTINEGYFVSGSSFGMAFSYDPTAGVATIVCNTTGAGDGVGVDPSAAFAAINPGYFDLLIADDPVPLALGPNNLISGAAIANWEDGGPIQVAALTAPLTKGPTNRDKVWFRRVGDTAHVRYEYEQSAPGSGGTGDYVYSLPAGLMFDSNKVEFFTGVYGIDFVRRSHGVLGWIYSTANGDSELQIVPYDLTRFRIFYVTITGSTSGFITAGTYSMGAANLRYVIEGFFPILGWSATQPVQVGRRYLWSERYASGAQRVTAAPTALGQYRSRRSGVDTAPTTPPAQADGMRLDSGSGIAAGRINHFEAFVGTGKIVALASSLNTGRAGALVTDLFLTPAGPSRGVSFSYDTTTGIASAYVWVANAADAVGTNADVSATPATGYVDFLIADDPVPVSADAALKAFYAGIDSATEISIGAASALTPNRMHAVSGITADYDITLPVNPAAGTVVGVRVTEYVGASKQYRLDAGVGVNISGRTRFLILVHTNVALLMWTGTAWRALVLCLDSPWVDAGVITITAVTTNPVKGTTVTDNLRWRRRGSQCEVRYRYYHQAAGANGTGIYRVGLPFPYDTAQVAIRVAENTPRSVAAGTASIGRANLSLTGSFETTGVLFVNASNNTTVNLSSVNEQGTVAYNWSSTAIALGNAEVAFGGDITYVPENW